MVYIHLPSGLRYYVLQPPRWSAPGPFRGDTVSVQCAGWIDTTHSSCYQICDTHTITFTIARGDVIQGIDSGVLTMRLGESRRLYIPASLAYGEDGDGTIVPPDTDVIFDVTLCDIW